MSRLLPDLGDLTVLTQFKVQTLQLHKFAGLAAVGLQRPPVPCVAPRGPWLGVPGTGETLD